MKAYDEDAKYILFINKSITILGCSTVNSLTIGFLRHISQQANLYLFCATKALSQVSPTFTKGFLSSFLHGRWFGSNKKGISLDFEFYEIEF